MKNQKAEKKVCDYFCKLLAVLITVVLTLTTSCCPPTIDESSRDDKGVWFIEGPETEDLYSVFERMGYAVATDRLWQAEVFRRFARGRLSEIFGSNFFDTDFLAADISLRTRNYSEQELQEGFDALDIESKDIITGYVAGFNRHIAEVRENNKLLPIEFVAIGALKGFKFIPEDRTPLDILAWLAAFQRDFDPEATKPDQIDNAALYNNLMEKFPNNYQGMFDDLRFINDPEALTFIENGETPSSTLMKITENRLWKKGTRDVPDLRQVSKDMNKTYNSVLESRKKINGYVKLGSQAWVVAGDKTASGNPIIYSGPQMAFQFDAPPTMQEGSIGAGGLNVSGMSIPGIPLILLGRTPHHAWSFQVGHGHSVDYYLEDPSDVFLHRTETIKVAGEDDFELKVYRTSHGPVVFPEMYDPSTYIPDPDNPIIAWKYSHWGYEFNAIRGIINMIRANNMDEFEEGLERVAVSMHVCYADRDGNIAYWMTGRDPARPDGEWRFPQGFVDSPLEWDAELLKPRSTDRNTTRGFYGGWNNKTNSSYPSGFNNFREIYGKFHRGHVIHDYLINNDNLTFEDMKSLALNIATTDSFGYGGNPWKFVKDYFSAAVLAKSSETRENALFIMEEWDGHFVAGGVSELVSGKHRADAWVLMDAWIREVIRLTFEDELETIPVIWDLEEKEGDETFSRYITTLLFNVFLNGIVEESSGIVNNYNWFQNQSDQAAPQNADDIIVKALDNVLENLGNRPWGRNKRGVIEHKHLLLGTVHTTPFASRSNYAQFVEYDATGPVRIDSVFHMGESGNIFSPHFRSMNKLFDSFEYRPFPLFD